MGQCGGVRVAISCSAPDSCRIRVVARKFAAITELILKKTNHKSCVRKFRDPGRRECAERHELRQSLDQRVPSLHVAALVALCRTRRSLEDLAARRRSTCVDLVAADRLPQPVPFETSCQAATSTPHSPTIGFSANRTSRSGAGGGLARRYVHCTMLLWQSNLLTHQSSLECGHLCRCTCILQPSSMAPSPGATSAYCMFDVTQSHATQSLLPAAVFSESLWCQHLSYWRVRAVDMAVSPYPTGTAGALAAALCQKIMSGCFSFVILIFRSDLPTGTSSMLISPAPGGESAGMWLYAVNAQQ